MTEQLKEVLLNIDGLDERFATLVIKYVEKYIDMSTNKSLVANNLIQQMKKNVTEISFKNLDGISGCVSGLGSSITIDSNLEDLFNTNTELKFKLYSLEYLIKKVDTGVEVYAILYQSRKSNYSSFKEIMNNYKVYNESLIDNLNRMKIIM